MIQKSFLSFVQVLAWGALANYRSRNSGQLLFTFHYCFSKKAPILHLIANNDVLRRTLESSFHRKSPEVHSPFREVTEGRDSGVLLLLCLLTQYLRWQGRPVAKIV